jgi:hypothetical protein
MIAGDSYPVAGGGRDSGTGGLGDGGPATGVLLGQPSGVAAAPAGSLLIGGTGGNRIRMVTGG